mmetsp:Transcript_9156/g.22790  ORF Transcript_9156/g.22790 Transcript_9156/m.22790 type:complete len:284 (-) Transcript_9156:973-1824(-)
MSVTRSRSFEAPVEESPSTTSSVTRPASITFISSSYTMRVLEIRSSDLLCTKPSVSPRQTMDAFTGGFAFVLNQATTACPASWMAVRWRSCGAITRERTSPPWIRSSASEKWVIVTCVALSAAARSAASLQRFATSAPVKPTVISASAVASRSLARAVTAIDAISSSLFSPFPCLVTPSPLVGCSTLAAAAAALAAAAAFAAPLVTLAAPLLMRACARAAADGGGGILGSRGAAYPWRRSRVCWCPITPPAARARPCIPTLSGWRAPTLAPTSAAMSPRLMPR